MQTTANLSDRNFYNVKPRIDGLYEDSGITSVEVLNIDLLEVSYPQNLSYFLMEVSLDLNIPSKQVLKGDLAREYGVKSETEVDGYITGITKCSFIYAIQFPKENILREKVRIKPMVIAKLDNTNTIINFTYNEKSVEFENLSRVNPIDYIFDLRSFTKYFDVSFLLERVYR